MTTSFKYISQNVEIGTYFPKKIKTFLFEITFHTWKENEPTKIWIISNTILVTFCIEKHFSSVNLQDRSIDSWIETQHII